MKRDLLDEATQALREADEGEGSGAAFTRARVMAGLHTGRVRRRTRVALLLPIAATFAAASAWGVSSENGRAFFQQMGHSLGVLAEPARAPEKPKHVRAPLRAAASVQDAPAAPPPALAPTQETRATPEAPPERAAPSHVAPSASAINAAAERELELYRVAHRAHFVDRDWQAALTAWDAYIKKSPGGRFVLEARYNRALCFLRLGRSAEARSALEPFARGAYGSYRQREATELLSALPQ